MDNSQPTPSQPVDDGATVRAPAPEVVFNRYDLLSELGKGGMGVVWLALDRELNSRVALKFLRDEMTSEDHALKELKGEVLINRDLAHPNIIKTFDFVTDTRRSAISMEFVDGVNLHKLKTKKPGKFFEVEEIKPWIVQLCDAVHYAHSQRVVHRDIKPANLMLNDRGEMKLGDFGIGRTVADTINRVTRNAAGTPPFMSPQQTMGEKSAPADDIYSIGATIYDLLTGEPPFFRGSIREQTLGKVPPSMTERRKELGRAGVAIPEDWEKAVASALAKEATARPPTAKALRELLEGKAVVVQPQRKGGGMLVGAAAAAVVLAGGGFFFWQQGRAPALDTKTTSTANVAGSGSTAAPAANPSAPSSQQAPQQSAPIASTETPALPPATQQAAPIFNPPQTAPQPATAANSAPSTALQGFPPAAIVNPPPVAAVQQTVAPVIERLVQRGSINQGEGVLLTQALLGLQGNPEKRLAERVIDAASPISAAEWRLYSGLVETSNETVSTLRPMLASGGINEKEFNWLLEAVGGQKNDAEKSVALAAIAKTLPLEQWRTQTDLYPERKLDPQMVKIKPFVDEGKLSAPEGEWLRAALMGEKVESEKNLATGLIETKELTTGQWRARTAFSYALPADDKVDPAKLPPAIDLALSPTVNMRLLRIDPGTFRHGPAAGEVGRTTNDQPQADVKIEQAFYIGVYEVTQGQVETLKVRNPSYWRSMAGKNNQNWPVDQVTWQDASIFITTLNGDLGKKYGNTLVADLPTEDEWEYAARAGTKNAYNNDKNLPQSPSPRDLQEVGLLANYNLPEGSTGSTPRPVGSFKPNAWGLYDMHGNVMEWTTNKYVRGGSWASKAGDVRSASRLQKSDTTIPSNQIGFRLVVRYKAPGSAPSSTK